MGKYGRGLIEVVDWIAQNSRVGEELSEQDWESVLTVQLAAFTFKLPTKNIARYVWAARKNGGTTP